MIERGEIDYTLKRPFTFFYDKSADNEAVYITIKEPTMAHCDDAIIMKECVGHLFTEVNNINQGKEVEKKEDADSSLDNKEELALFLQDAATMYGNGILEKMVSTFKRMAFNKKSPICLINGDAEFRDLSWERLSIDDAIGMACCFAANFSMPRGAEKKESARPSESHTQAKVEPVIEIT